MSLRFGIDLGTTYSAISWYDDYNRRVEVVDLETADGKSVIPSVVYYEAGGNITVGESAVNAGTQYPERVITGIKRAMGEDYKTPPIDGAEYTPQQVSAEILKVLKHDAQLFSGEPVTDAVISVPAYFGDRERKATIEAAELAELNVLEIIPEPHAAAMAFSVDRIKDVENRNLLVYDLGGGTFDITLVKTEKETTASGAYGLRMTTLVKEGNRQLGGLDWDRVLARMAADKAVSEHGIVDPMIDAKTEAALLKDCQQVKRDLSKLSSLKITVEGKDVDITRSEFEDQTRDLVLQTEKNIRMVLDQAEKTHGLLTEKAIEEKVAAGTPRDQMEDKKISLLLCGGATRMPMIKEMVTRVMGEEPLTHKNPELLVTVGAAYRAYLLEQEGGMEIQTRDGNVALLPGGGDTGKAIGVEVIEVDDGNNITRRQIEPVIEAGAKAEEVFQKEFGTAFDNMTEVTLVFYEGDSPDPDLCTRQADVTITGLPSGRPAGRPVRVKLWYDRNGVVCGQAADVESGKEAEVKIERWNVS